MISTGNHFKNNENNKKENTSLWKFDEIMDKNNEKEHFKMMII